MKKALYICIILLGFLHFNNVETTRIVSNEASNLLNESVKYSQENTFKSFEVPGIVTTISSLDFSYENTHFLQIFTVKINPLADFYNVYIELFLQNGFKQYQEYWINLLVNYSKTILLFPFHSFL